MMIANWLFDLPDVDIEIYGRDVLFSKGRGVRFLRSLLSLVNVYLTPAWVVFTNEVYPNRAQLRSGTIPEGKYIQLQNSFFPLLSFPIKP